MYYQKGPPIETPTIVQATLVIENFVLARDLCVQYRQVKKADDVGALLSPIFAAM